MRGARRSVTQMDLEKFEQFRRKFDPSFASKNQGSGPQFKWPSSNNSAQNRPADDDEELYS